jgi:GDP/UDP-N,N'-diacetylbacillosamine 2-epimerase (hydrolysing)
LKVALLTSSRADYGIYRPVIIELEKDAFFDLHIIAFGTHLSALYGLSMQHIIDDGFEIDHQIDTMPDGDSPLAISAAIGKTATNFSILWNKESYDLIIALGDRYEMFAACAAAIPYNIPIAHIHGGETTLGAIDDAFRNAITQMATFHFATTEKYKQRIIEMKGSELHVYNVGALSVDNLRALKLFSIDQMKERFGIDLSLPSILITFHPETVAFNKNKEYIHQLISALDQIDGYQFIITMPNADTMGNMIREELIKFVEQTPSAIAIESFGTIGYLSCMKYCSMMLGNTSSGFVEAAFFPKYVINLGDRQLGRILTPNIYSCAIQKDEIINAISRYRQADLSQINIYGDGTAAYKIASHLRIEFS